MKKLMLALIVFGILLPGFSFAQTVGQPETVEDVKNLAEKAWEVIKNDLSGIIKKIWQENVWPIWKKMYDWFMKNIWPPVVNLYNKYIKPELDKRKPGLKEEFEKEKEELKEEAPKVGKSLWQKLKDLIK